MTNCRLKWIKKFCWLQDFLFLEFREFCFKNRSFTVLLNFIYINDSAILMLLYWQSILFFHQPTRYNRIVTNPCWNPFFPNMRRIAWTHSNCVWWNFSIPSDTQNTENVLSTKWIVFLLLLCAVVMFCLSRWPQVLSQNQLYFYPFHTTKSVFLSIFDRHHCRLALCRACWTVFENSLSLTLYLEAAFTKFNQWNRLKTQSLVFYSICAWFVDDIEIALEFKLTLARSYYFSFFLLFSINCDWIFLRIDKNFWATKKEVLDDMTIFFLLGYLEVRISGI